MKRFLWEIIIGIIFSFISTSILSAQPCDEPSVVAIYIINDQGNEELQGAGFLVTDEGHILTAKHVIKDDNGPFHLVRLKFCNYQKKISARLLCADPIFDFALLKFDTNDLKSPVKPINFGNSFNIKAGEKLSIIGHPIRNERVVLFESANLPIQSAQNGLFVINGDLVEGQSGGPVLNSSGKLVGVVVKRDLNANVSYVVPIHFTQDLLLSVGVNPVFVEETGYRANLKRLQDSVKKLNDKLDFYEKALSFLLIDLEWGIESKLKDILDINIDNQKKTVLRIFYKKKFEEQTKPDDNMLVEVIVGLKEELFKELTAEQKSLVLKPILFQKSFNSTNEIPLKELDDRIKGHISFCKKYKAIKSTDITNIIDNIEVIITPEFKDYGPYESRWVLNYPAKD